jgi:hypothetical protein
MTDFEIDKFYADVNASVMESVFAFEAEVNASLIDPETAPDPAFAEMSWPEICEALDDYWLESMLDQNEREWQRDNRWSDLW